MLRFAPSPTGDMHIGNLRAAIFNYLMAQKLKQKFIIRIEDTDLDRNIANKDKEILKILEIFGLKYDDLIYQSHNFPLHRELAQRLLKEGKAFYCYCSKEFLESKRQEAKEKKQAFRYDDSWAQVEKGEKKTSPIIRLHAGEAVSFTDAIKGEISFKKGEIDSFVIMRNDVPTYNFACAIDDREMSYIIRGEDHVSNTPKQILIKRALGFSGDVKYAHLPIILNEENKKMSKRDAASSVQWLLSQGFLPQAIANYLIILGNASVERTCGELFSYESLLDSMGDSFDVANVSSSPAHFDYKKMLQINREILRNEPMNYFYEKLGNLECGVKIDSKFDNLIKLYLGESSSILELENHFNNIFASLESKREKSEYKAEFDKILEILRSLDSIKSRADFGVDSKDSNAFNIESRADSIESYEDFKNYLMQKSGLKGKFFFKPLRMILSGEEHGIELDKLYPALRPLLPLLLK